MALTVDTRTATEYGVVRTFGQADFQFRHLGSSNSNPTTSAGFAGSAAPTACSTPPAAATSRLKCVFIQFAGFTFGKSASAYATPWHGYPGNNNSFLMGGA